MLPELLDTLEDVLNFLIRLKGPTYESGTRLQAASGLHHLIGNHYHVLVRPKMESWSSNLLNYHLSTQIRREHLTKTLRNLCANIWITTSPSSMYVCPQSSYPESPKPIVTVQERSKSYERALKEKSDIIRQTEQGNMNKKARSASAFHCAHSKR